MRTHRCVSLASLGGALLGAILGTASRADDLVPPLWTRGGPLTTSAEWDFLTPQPIFTFLPPDGQSVPLVVGNGGGSGGLPDTPVLMVQGMEWIPGISGTGAYLSNGNEGFLSGIPNWIDDEPLKKVQVQFTYENVTGSGFPSIIGLHADDPLGASETFLGASTIALLDGRFHRVEHWRITPNPDRERIVVLVPDGVAVDQVIVDTISTVPEPSSFAIAGIGLAALVYWRRRRDRR